MYFKVKSFFLFIFLCTAVFGQESQQKSIAVTVYNENRGVVKDNRTINIKSGTSSIAIKDVAQLIDPTSVHIKLDGEVIEQNYQYDLINAAKILQKYLDKDIQLISDKGEVLEGKLLSSSDQIVLQKKDGGLIMVPNLTNYRISVGSLPEGLITTPTLLWTVNSKTSKNQDVEISYQTSGMNWHAEYVAVLNENDTKLDLNSWVSVENQSGTTYKDATLKLVAGDVNLIKERQPLRKDMMYAREEAVAAGAPQFQEKEFFEYHIYNLQRPTTLSNNETKQISLFQASNVNVTKKFLYKSGSPYYPVYGQGTSKGKVAVVVEFDNKSDNNLGMPMPKGKVRLNKSDGKSIEFIGEDMIDHTPKDEKVKLRIGDAFDIVAEEIQSDNKRISDKIYEQTFEITLRNRKKEDITVEVERYLGLNWEVLNSSLDYQKKDAQNITFKVPVAKNGETKLKFAVRYTY
ncbi:MAG: DUF4139 domain-containing protein [Bacteroidota bacterium]|nr:DUF4139 domain-containing protein [Bacteroidota bacterium]MDP4190139.1 DUF4139 domain-containing protein [Bacteroidota bacterium]